MLFYGDQTRVEDTRAKLAGIANFHNAFASIYEGRYLAGIAAGMKLNEMIEAGEFTAEPLQAQPHHSYVPQGARHRLGGYDRRVYQ